MNSHNGGRARWIGGIARILSLVLLVYWGLFALLAPVTDWDSQVYNLGRLPIARLGGLFHNPLWTTPRQLMFPWTFDAVHLPFLALGFGYGLPSYCCLLGVLAVAWSFLSERHGREAGWIGVLGLLALPALVFQAVITKNDIPVLLGVAVWFHALRLWRRDGRRVHLVFSALAIGFACGSKTSGVLPAALCLGISCRVLLRSRAGLTWFVTATVASCVLLGSVETYVASYQRFGHPMGPAAVVQNHRNRDGLRGAAANAVRYALGNIDLGIEAWQAPDRVTPTLESACRGLLGRLGLAESGYRSDFSDPQLAFLKNPGDSQSDYGLPGTACLAVLVLAACRWRPDEDWWRMCLFGGTVAAGICYSIAWMPWNDRFLLVPFALVTLALVSLVQRHFPGSRWASGALLLLFGYSAVAGPLLSTNFRPGDLIASVTDRTRKEFKDRPPMLPVYEAARSWQEAHPQGRIHLLAGVDSWVLPFLMLPNHAVRPLGMDPSRADLRKTLSGGGPSALLVLNHADFDTSGLPLAVLQSFPGDAGAELFEVTQGTR
jgi:hypothetical protein